MNSIFSGYSNSFDTGVAAYFKDVNVALVLNHIIFWLKKNKAKGINQIEGKTWMYETISEIASQFDFLTERQVKYCITKLVDAGILVKGNFNRNAFDKVPWYALADESPLDKNRPSMEQNCPIEETELSHPKNKIVPSVIIEEDKKTDKKTNIAQTAAPLRKDEISFSFFTRHFENIKEQDLAAWRTAYPSINLQQEIAKAEQWCASNPTKSKSKKLWRKFLTGWFQKAEDTKSNKAAYASQNAKSVDRRTVDQNGIPVSSPADGRF